MQHGIGRSIASGVAILAAAIMPSSAAAAQHGGGAAPPPRDAMTDERRVEIERATARNVALLKAEGRLDKTAGAPVRFAWPVAPYNGLDEHGYHGISNYVDQDPAFPGALLDFACGTRSYDLPNGYNHRGTDIYSWPNPWRYMDEDKVAIVAGAPGVIVYKEDAHQDMSCSFNSLPWNAVYVAHADGSIAWYGHLKQDSATAKSVGDTVDTGEYLGIMGSSGSSTGPHLHFELWSDETYTALLDPWQGACNSLNPDSRWLAQRPYHDQGLNQLTVGLAAPDAVPPCPSIESPNEQYDIPGGQIAYFTMYVRDLMAGQVTAFEIRRPDGTVWHNWGHSGPQYYSGSYWFWSWQLPAGPDGTWTFRVTYAGQVYEQQFNIGTTAAAGSLPSSRGQGRPLRVDKAGAGSYALSWGASCKSSDSDHAVYEGTLGDFDSHYSRLCSTGGERETTLTAGQENLYWLVAPRTAFREGGLGSDSAGEPRPQAASACLSRATDCP